MSTIKVHSGEPTINRKKNGGSVALNTRCLDVRPVGHELLHGPEAPGEGRPVEGGPALAVLIVDLRAAKLASHELRRPSRNESWTPVRHCEETKTRSWTVAPCSSRSSTHAG